MCCTFVWVNFTIKQTVNMDSRTSRVLLPLTQTCPPPVTRPVLNIQLSGISFSPGHCWDQHPETDGGFPPSSSRHWWTGFGQKSEWSPVSPWGSMRPDLTKPKPKLFLFVFTVLTSFSQTPEKWKHGFRNDDSDRLGPVTRIGKKLTSCDSSASRPYKHVLYMTTRGRGAAGNKERCRPTLFHEYLVCVTHLQNTWCKD